MGDVVELDVLTKLDMPVERIIDRARDHGLAEVVICGFGTDGEFYFAASRADGGSVLWALEVAKKRLLGVADG